MLATTKCSRLTRYATRTGCLTIVILAAFWLLAADGQAKTLLGLRLSRSWTVPNVGTEIRLPIGTWTVTGLLVGGRKVHKPLVTAVLARERGKTLTGLIWLRTSNLANAANLGVWCSGGARQHLESISAPGLDEGCLWVRAWNSVQPINMARYWKDTFNYLQAHGIPRPRRGMIAAGFHLVGCGYVTTVEYTFNAELNSVEDVLAWTRQWRPQVVRAFTRRC